MKPSAYVVALAMLGLTSSQSRAADGPAAAFNEAVKIVNGQRVVEVAPFPKHMQHAVVNFKKPTEFVNEVFVFTIETGQGLMDCHGTPWYHPKACSPSTFGKAVRERTWIVLMNRHWFMCPSHISTKRCAELLVDGVLRPTPSSEE